MNHAHQGLIGYLNTISASSVKNILKTKKNSIFYQGNRIKI